MQSSFSQSEDPNFEILQASMILDLLNGLRLTLQVNLILEKSGNSVPSGEWKPSEITDQQNVHVSHPFIVLQLIRH